jgi:hypothetical protein
MRSILETCHPRPDIQTGSFNPEIFTASLSLAIAHDQFRNGCESLGNLRLTHYARRSGQGPGGGAYARTLAGASAT